MDTKQRMNYVYEGGNFYLRVMGDAAHMEHTDHGIYEVMRPLEGCEGPSSIFNIRTDHLSDDDLENAVKCIRDRNMHTWWPFNMSKRLMEVLYRDTLKPSEDGFELYACMLSDEMPTYPPCPEEISVRRVADPDAFGIWCSNDSKYEHNGFQIFDKNNHYHLILNGKMRCYLGYHHGRPVTTAAILSNNGIASLEFVSTAPEYRQRGIAKAVCQTAIQEAFRDGAGLITIRAINDGRILGASLGFGYLNGTRGGIMSCTSQIPYDKVNVMETLKDEAIRTLGEEKWNEITRDIQMPADGMEPEHLNHLTRELLRRFDALVDSPVCASIFCNVKHGLKHDDFLWAREKFLEHKDIDSFCSSMYQETLEGFERALSSGERYHGQPVDASVMQFVREHPDLLYGTRENNTITATAIPCETMKYLKEDDICKKRYFACHCPFARKSILQKEGAVSNTLCHCSLGHTKIFWEAALNTHLEGEVVGSVLGDGLLCSFRIHLPETIVQRYVSVKNECR